MKTIPVSLLALGLFLPAVALAQPDGPPPGPPQGPPPEGRPHDGEGDRKGGGEGDRKDKGGPFRGMAEAWQTADTDHDGMLSITEFATLPRIEKLPDDKRNHLFERLDKDKDGKISRPELEGMMRDGEGPIKRLWELDTDKSGGVSFDEFKAGPIFQKLPPEKQEEVFKRLDTDGDGMITPKDKPEPFKRPDGRPGGPDGKGHHGPDGDGPPHFNQQLDTDKDGALSFEEFRKGERVSKLGEDEQEQIFQKLDKNNDLKLTPDEFGPPPPPKDSVPAKEVTPAEEKPAQ